MSSAPAQLRALETEAAEQRRWPRTPRKRTFMIHALSDGQIGPPMPTRVQDFSAMGLGLIHSRRLLEGTQFLAPLATSTGDPIPLIYCVARCTPLPNGLYRIGAELVCLLDFKDFSERFPECSTLRDYLEIAI